MPRKRALIILVAAFAAIGGYVAAPTPAFAEVLHRFSNSGKDGYWSFAGLTMDAAGHLYGTTSNGGFTNRRCPFGCGTVFQLTRGANGTWTETMRHSFGRRTDGRNPYGGLVLDQAGNVYGTTAGGGAYDGGTVFKMARSANGKWTETLLYSFCPSRQNNCVDGDEPSSGLIFDSVGNLYGTANQGGNGGCGGYGCGIVFELMPGASGNWTETVLYEFSEFNDAARRAGLILDVAGNLYGTTLEGGANNGGTVFELAPGANGMWNETVLYSFCSANNCADGQGPIASLTIDAAGNLYGTTTQGGKYRNCEYGGCGTVFQLTPGAGGDGLSDSQSRNGQEQHCVA